MLLDGHFEGSLAENHAHQGTGRNLTKGGRCMYIFYVIAGTDCRLVRRSNN